MKLIDTLAERFDSVLQAACGKSSGSEILTLRTRRTPMKCAIAKAGGLAVLGLFLAVAGWAQQAPSLNQPKPGQPAKGGPVVSKDENNAYKAIYAAQKSDPMHLIELGEAFVAKYPMSYYAGAVYGMLTATYLATNQTDKMIDAGNKALTLDPDNVDVLPILAWAIPRRVNGNSGDSLQMLQKAQGYAHHGLDLMAAAEKPKEMSDEEFAKAKNEKISMCHDGLGVVAVKTGHNDEAITELTQAIQLSADPDPVDNYLLGIAQENSSHFTDAISNFTKCSANGPMQAQCKAQLDATKKKSQNSLEAPQ
jgi:tetratricopeptide (TPR) repeat protein